MVRPYSSTSPSTTLIVEVKRLSDSDGPGLRDVVFFKGCPLRCDFCHNPESQAAHAELAFHESRCIQCSGCVTACPSAAVSLTHSEHVDRTRCQQCGECAAQCPTGALRMVGTRVTLDALLAGLLLDTPYFRHSGGGVTLSGGECTYELDFSGALAKRLHEDHGLHVAIETCGHFDWSRFATQLLPFVDWIFFDLKLASPELHRQVTGRDNTLIQANLLRLLALVPDKVHPRIPLIPGLTDTRENLMSLASLLVSEGARTVSLLPYNPLGLPLYKALGRPTPALPEQHYSPAHLARLHEEFQSLLQDLLGNRASTGPT